MLFYIIVSWHIQLDNVSAGLTEWKGLLKDYWTRFSSYCERAATLHIHQVWSIQIPDASFKKNMFFFGKVNAAFKSVRWRRCWRKHTGISSLLLFPIKTGHVQGILYIVYLKG